MAYPGDVVITEQSAATSVTVRMPVHKVGDMVLVNVAQDATSTLSVSAPWVLITTGTAGGGTRLCMYAIADVAELTSPTVTSNVSAAFNTIAVTVSDADTSNPIETWGVSSATGSTGIYGPSITTSTSDALILTCFVSDGTVRLRFPFDQLYILGKTVTGNVTNLVGYRHFEGPGLAPAPTEGRMALSDTWMCVSVAIKNANSGAIPPEFGVHPVELRPYSSNSPTISFTGINTVIGTLAGESTYAATTFMAPVTTYNNYEGLGRLNHAPLANQPGWHGGFHSVSSTDFTKGPLSLFLYCGISSLVGPKGWVVILLDASNNWAAYQLTNPSETPGNTYKTVVLNFPDITPLDSSPTLPNLASIVNMGYAWHRVNTTSTSAGELYMAFPWHWRDVSLIKGSSKSPASPSAAMRLISAYGVPHVSPLQGANQSYLRFPLIIGNGVIKTVADLKAGESVDFAVKKSEQQVSPYSLYLKVKASSTDVVDFSFSSISSELPQKLLVDPSSSPSASYVFNGAILAGLEIDFGISFLCEGASFFSCKTILLGTAQIKDCSVIDSAAATGIVTSNPSNIIDCRLKHGPLSGHAIEITQPGTFSFVGNTFEGYGLDGTTDAAIYNNSGGHVTLNVSGGGDAPTVRNGVGATTDVVSGAQITVVGLAAGSQVKVTKVSNGDVLFNGAESLGEVSFSTTYIGAIRIDARKASASPFYKPWFSQANTVSGQTVEITALQELDE